MIFSITTVYHDVLSDCLGNTDQKHRRRKWYRITDTIESIDTFVSIGDFDTMSIVSPITSLDASTPQHIHSIMVSFCNTAL